MIDKKDYVHLNDDNSLEILEYINSYIHNRNKKLKYCYNPMIQYDAMKAIEETLKTWTSQLLGNMNKQDENKKYATMEITLLGNFPVDKLEEEDVYTYKIYASNESNGIAAYGTMTLDQFKSQCENYVMLEHPTRKDTYQGVSVRFIPISNE